MKSCNNCDVYIDDNLNFCPYCGANYVEANDASNNTQQQDSNNGPQNWDNSQANYQQHSDTYATQNQAFGYQPQNLNNTYQQAQNSYGPVNQNIPGQYTVNANTSYNQNKSSDGKGVRIAIIVVSILLALIVCGVAAFLIITNFSDDSNASPTVTAPGATAPITTQPATTEPVSTIPETTAPVTTAPVTTTVYTTTAPQITVPYGVEAPGTAVAPYTMRVANTNGHGLLLRNGPSTSNGKIANLADGTIVTVLGTTSYYSDWFYVSVNGTYGWCCSYHDNTVYLVNY